VTELARTAPASAATRYRSIQQLFNWLDEEGEVDMTGWRAAVPRAT
jgi:hypothetical protein